MQELILYIKPQQRDKTDQNYVKVDLFTDENVSLTQVIQDVRDIDKVFTDYSRTFNLPASEKNNKLFKHWYNPDVKGFDANIQSDAKIELNYQPFREGKIRLQEVKMKDNRPHTYKITFFGKTVSLSNTLGEDKLNDLVWLDNFAFTNSAANVKTGLDTGFNVTVDSVTYNNAVIHPLISINQRYIFNSTGNDTDGGNISTSGSNNTQRGVMPEDLKPAIKASLIVKAIEEQYGITFKTGEFFDSTEFSNLYLWLHRNKGAIDSTSSKVINESFNCTNVVPASGSTACNFFSTTTEAQFVDGKYKIEKTNNLRGFASQIIITPAGGFTTQNYTIQVLNELNNELLGQLSGTGTLTLAVGFDYIGNEMAIGEKKEIVVKIISSSTFTFASQIDVQVFQGTAIPLVEYRARYNQVAASTSTASSSLLPTNQIPDLKIVDFLKGIFKMFNLTAFLDSSDRVVVKTLDDFYSDSTTTHDISKFIVKDEHTVSEALPFSDINFKYPEPETKLAQAFKNINNREYGKLEYTADASKSRKYVVETVFSHMLFERLTDLNDSSNTDIHYGLCTDESDNTVLPKPLIFYGIYNNVNTTDINFVESTRPEGGGLAPAGTRHSITNYWMPHNASEIGTTSTAPAFNLNFGSEINSYTLTDYGGQNNSLFLKFHKDFILRTFNTKTRIFKYKAVLPLKFLLTYSLADKVFISGRAFTINKITTDLQTGRSTLELLNEPS
tara:strand:+ start:6537 stop:8717 length:2181 start_codon:yes stop_codon:yes gene_type:complete